MRNRSFLTSLITAMIYAAACAQAAPAADYIGTQMYPGANDLSAGDSVTTKNPYEHAIYCSQFMDLTLNGIKIKTFGEHATGVWGDNHNVIKVLNSHISTEDEGRGVMIMGNSSCEIADTEIDTLGNKGMGCFANRSSLSVRGIRISTNGGEAYGAAAASYSGLKADGAEVVTRGASSHAVFADVASSADVMGGRLYTEGENSHGVYANDRSFAHVSDSDIETGGDRSHGICAMEKSELRAENIKVAANGAGAAALHASGGSSVKVDGIEVSGRRSANICTIDGGSVTVRNMKQKGDFGRLLDVKNGGKFEAVSSVLSGSVFYSGNDGLDLAFNGGCRWAGGVYGSMDVSVPDRRGVALSIDGTSSWSVGTAGANEAAAWPSANHFDSIDNAGVIDFGSSGGQKIVTAIKYSGAPGSVLKMKTGIGGTGASDLLDITGSAGGTSAISVYNAANAGAVRSTALVRAAGTGGLFDLADHDENRAGVKYIHAGAWKYALVKEADSSGSEWYLKRGDKLSLMGEDGLTPTGKAIAAAAFMYDTWHTEAGTLTKRMGIYRDGLWKGGLWAEAALSRVDLGYDGLRGASDRRKFKTAAIGYDRRIENRGAIFWYGVMAGYGKDDIDVPFGKKELKSTYAALYGVYRRSGGLYLNALTKYNRYESKLDVTNPDGFSRRVLGLGSVNGEWGSNGTGVSLQAGKKILFSGGAGSDGWYLEPQLQFSWNRVSGADFVTNSGITVNIGSADYVRLRGGLLLGRLWQLKNGGLLDVYCDASVVRDSDTKISSVMSEGLYESSIGGTRGVYGVGCNWGCAKGKYIHLRLQHSNGKAAHEPLAVYAGLSFEI